MGLLKLAGKAAWWQTKRKARSYKTESTVALAALGAAVVAREVWLARQRSQAMRGKVVVIVGGSRGLGLQIAREFGVAGAHLVLSSRKEDELRDALAYLQREGAIPNGDAAHTVVADITRREACANVIGSAMHRYGRVDVLINCAATMQVAPIEDMPHGAFEEAMDVNFFGALHTTQAVLPHMVGRGSGCIVNIASIGGKIAVPHMLPYVASKFALVGFSEGLHAEMRHKGVHVLTVCPGLMRTGAEVQVNFAGNAEKEYAWFKFGATAPLVSVSARAAARKIFAATVAQKAEITITPQAWLGARAVGLAPNFSQTFAAAVNRFVLPEPNGNKQTMSGMELEARKATC